MKTLIPSGNCLVNNTLESLVDLGELLWVQVVDIARELDGAIITKRDVRREPLICGGPEDAVTFGLFVFRDGCAFSNMVQGVMYTDDFLLNEFGAA
jgi:hypothetical protein